MLEAISGNFHFLRPAWLWGLFPTALLLLFLSRRLDPRRRWARVIAPHLLDHLTIEPGRRVRMRPIHLVTAVAALACLGAAGPTWQREVSPFAEDTAPLVIVLELSQSMDAIDVQPTRAERAKQKIRDLLALRTGARTALIAYAGSAHTVLPLSNDAAMFEAFLDGLSTSIMPVPGDDPVGALALADSVLARDSVPGSILFVTDGIAAEAAPAFARHQSNSRDALLVLAIGTSAGGPIRTGENQFATDDSGRRVVAVLDRAGLDALGSATSAFVAGATVDARDVERIQRRIQSNLRQVQQDDPAARWNDAGYYLLYPIVLLALLWFRRGWTVRWSAVAVVMALGGCAPGSEAGGFQSGRPFVDLWLTPDQQGRRLYEAARYGDAAERFEDPAWRATALFRAGEFGAAIDAWALADGPEADFGMGNALALTGDYPAAVEAFDRALAGRPGWPEARENRAYVASMIPPPPEDEPPSGEGAPPPNLGADSVAFDNEEQRGERGEVRQGLVSDDQLAELWLRRLQTSPGDFLRRRFLIEEARRTATRGAGG
jgi:Ca-activated chloride channel family protein